MKQVQQYIQKCWIEILKVLSEEKIDKVLQPFDIKSVNNIVKATGSPPQISENCLVKLLSATSKITYL